MNLDQLVSEGHQPEEGPNERVDTTIVKISLRRGRDGYSEAGLGCST